MGAQRVVDGDGAVGTAHADVDVEPEDELATGDGRVLGADRLVARPRVERPDAGGERVRAGARHPQAVAGGGREVGAGAGQLAGRGGHRGVRLGDDLELGGRHLELEARVPGKRGDDLDRPGCEVERAGVEQHQLLLEAHGAVHRRVERGPQAGRGGERIGHDRGEGRRPPRRSSRSSAGASQRAGVDAEPRWVAE